jgi:ElaB/YqjD/DUF883 family membrane-anchored ribosome-binding protein
VGERTDAIRQDIAETRASLEHKLETLETKTRQTLSLKRQVSNKPWMAIGAAVATGFIAAALTRRRSDY